MPVFDYLLGYSVFFHSNEPNEPIHVHIGTERCNVKIWMLVDGSVRLETNGKYGNNISKFKSREIKRFVAFAGANRNEIIDKWINHFHGGQLKNF